MSAELGRAEWGADDDRTVDTLEDLLNDFESLEAGTDEGKRLRRCTEALVRYFAAHPDDDANLLRFARAIVARLAGSRSPAWFAVDPNLGTIIEPSCALGWAPLAHRPPRSLNEKVFDGVLAHMQIEVIRREHRFGSGKRCLGIDHPLLPAQPIRPQTRRKKAVT